MNMNMERRVGTRGLLNYLERRIKARSLASRGTMEERAGERRLSLFGSPPPSQEVFSGKKGSPSPLPSPPRRGSPFAIAAFAARFSGAVPMWKKPAVFIGKPPSLTLPPFVPLGEREWSPARAERRALPGQFVPDGERESTRG